MGEIRDAPILGEFKNAKTLAAAAKIAARMLDGERPFEEQFVSLYNQKTGKPERQEWRPSDHRWGREICFWPTYDWNLPSLKGSPVAGLLLRETKRGPIAVGSVLFRYVPEHGDGGGTVPESIVVERVKVAQDS